MKMRGWQGGDRPMQGQALGELGSCPKAQDTVQVWEEYRLPPAGRECWKLHPPLQGGSAVDGPRFLSELCAGPFLPPSSAAWK